MWSEHEVEVRDYLDAGDQVVVLSSERGHGQASGVVVERRLGTVYTAEEADA